MLFFYGFIALSAVGAAILAPQLASGIWIPLLWLGLFAGFFLALLILFALVIWISSLFVDMSKVQEKYNRYYGFMARQLVDLVMKLAGIHVHKTGLEMVPEDGVFLLVSNHIADLDPAVFLHALPRARLAFVSKRENERIYMVNKYMHAIQCQSINRENDREALKTILRTAEILREGVHCMGIFPEGYESKTGDLLPFRNGAFKIAQRAHVPIVVAVLRNTKSIAKNIFRRRTDVDMEILGVIPADALVGVTTRDLGDRVHRMMETALEQKGAV